MDGDSNWLHGVIVALIAFGVGIAAGLAIAASTGKSIAKVACERDQLREECTSTQTERDALKKDIARLRDRGPVGGDEPPKESDWNAWNVICDRFGPRTPFAAFARRLEGAGCWNPSHAWTIAGNGHFAELNVDSRKCHVHGVVVVCPRPFNDRNVIDTATLLFDSEGLFFSQVDHASRDNITNLFSGFGKALGLTEEELGRLRKVGELVPITAPKARLQGIVQMVLALPTRVQVQFTDRLETLDEDDPADTEHFPIVGFNLGKHCAELCFAGTEGYSDRNYNYRKFGPWWSLVIHPEGQDGLSGNSTRAWPRLSTREMDALHPIAAASNATR